MATKTSLAFPSSFRANLMYGAEQVLQHCAFALVNFGGY